MISKGTFQALKQHISHLLLLGRPIGHIIVVKIECFVARAGGESLST